MCSLIEAKADGIRPETLLVFQNDKSELAALFLLGFEGARTAEGRTLKASDTAWEKDLYRHPRRQGLGREDDLGACLLEIGLWCTFVAYQDATANKPMPSIVYPRCDDAASKHELNRATVLKSSLVSFAERELTSRIGDKYAKVVVSCLTCLDTSNPDVIDESEFTDDDNVGVGVRYFEKILLKLSNVSV
ncbi:het-s domain-containing protein [Stemphylium lycopersici]|nr:het-s domain-containing protein [Stemphylium lycopersici]